MGCHFLLQGIFLTQGSNSPLLSFLHWQVDSLPLSHLGSPTENYSGLQIITPKGGGRTSCLFISRTSCLFINFPSALMGFPDSSVKNQPAMQETQVRSLGQEDPLEEEMATHSSILGWEIPWTEEPGGS